MKTWKRLKTTVLASFDNLVSEIENHQALVDCSIREADRAAIASKVQLKKIRKQNQSTQQDIDDLEKSRNEWIWRTREVYTAQPDMSLECVKRIEMIEQQIKHKKLQLKENQTAEQKLTQEFSIIQQKLEQLKQKRHQLAARESSSQALKLLNSAEASSIGELDEAFSRWEDYIARLEVQAENLGNHHDDIEAGFLIKEEGERLESRLNSILNDNKEGQ